MTEPKAWQVLGLDPDALGSLETVILRNVLTAHESSALGRIYVTLNRPEPAPEVIKRVDTYQRLTDLLKTHAPVEIDWQAHSGFRITRLPLGRGIVSSIAFGARDLADAVADSLSGFNSNPRT